jgi:ribonuclease HII
LAILKEEPMKRQRLPKYVGMTLRKLKKEKRHDFKELQKAMDKFSFGVAFAPNEAYDSFNRVKKELDTMKLILQKWWKNA